jgi:predicted small lipoprotein YifL
MDDSTNTNTYMSSPPTPEPKKKTGKVILWVLLVLVLIAGGVAGGYYYANMNKNSEVEAAKQSAKADADKQAAATIKKAASDAEVKTQAKTGTDTTCNADELGLAVAPSANSGAGTIVYDLTLTNMGKRTCTLGGFPGVSLVNANGNMIGLPAERAKNYTEKKLTLAPNAKVKAEMATANSANFSDGQCKEGAAKIRVYPPSDAGYLSVASPVASWCPGFSISPVLSM